MPVRPRRRLRSQLVPRWWTRVVFVPRGREPSTAGALLLDVRVMISCSLMADVVFVGPDDSPLMILRLTPVLGGMTLRRTRWEAGYRRSPLLNGGRVESVSNY